MSRRNYMVNGFAGNMWDDLFNEAFGLAPARTNANRMKTDIQENENGFQIEMDLPGFAKDDITANLKEGTLTITAKHNEENETKDEKTHYIRKERYSGQYQRSFYVGDELTQEDIKARFANGVLTLFVPKKERTPEVEQKHYISIEG